MQYTVDIQYLFILAIFNTAVEHLFDDTFKPTVHWNRFIVAVGVGNTQLHVLINAFGCSTRHPCFLRAFVNVAVKTLRLL